VNRHSERWQGSWEASERIWVPGRGREIPSLTTPKPQPYARNDGVVVVILSSEYSRGERIRVPGEGEEIPSLTSLKPQLYARNDGLGLVILSGCKGPWRRAKESGSRGGGRFRRLPHRCPGHTLGMTEGRGRRFRRLPHSNPTIRSE
jgi:hypothetical protein